jgi:hypothetical protein
MKHNLAVTFILVLCAAQSWSQSDSSQSNNPPPYHPSVNGDSGSLAFSSEAERINLLSGGFTLSSTYDDNAFSSPKDPIGSVGYMVMPNLSIVESTARTRWALNYNPGFIWNQRGSSQYQADHNLDFNSQYRVTERLTARIHENFVDESSSFDELNQNPLLPGTNVLSQPNPSVLTPLTNQKFSITNADLVDQTGEATNIGASGNFNKLSFQDTISGPVQLLNNESWGGDAFCSHYFTARQSLGVTYTFQNIATFGEILEHAQTQSMLLYYTVNLRPGVTLSLFSGPDHTITKDQFAYDLGPVAVPITQHQSMWLADEGATFGWQGQQTSVRIDLIHHVTDGAGGTGAVQLYSAVAGVRRQLSRAWTGDIALNYDHNNPLSHYFGNAFADYVGSAGLDRTIGEHFSVAVRYGRYFQRFEAFGTNSSNYSANHNRAWVSFSYHFSHPLG